MKYLIGLIIGVSLTLLGMYFLNLPSTTSERTELNSSEILNDNSDTKSIDVKVEKEPFELSSPNGETSGEYKEHDRVFVVYGDEERELFSERKIRLVEYELSPNKNHVYFLIGEVSQDAAVRAYIFSAKEDVLEPVRPYDSPREGYYGFGSEAHVAIRWQTNNLLIIEHDNPALAPGAGESGPSIGLQMFESVSEDTPWFVSLVE